MTNKLKDSLQRFAQAFNVDLNALMEQPVPGYGQQDLTLLKPHCVGGKRRPTDSKQLGTSRLTPKE